MVSPGFNARTAFRPIRFRSDIASYRIATFRAQIVANADSRLQEKMPINTGHSLAHTSIYKRAQTPGIALRRQGVWADDPDRRAIAGVPDSVRFQTKPEIALQQMRQALADGVPSGVALMDPAYGDDSKLRAGISELVLAYVAGIQPTTMVWRPGEAPLPPAPRSGRGRPGTRLRRDETHQPSRPRPWLWNLPPMPGNKPCGATAATRR